MVDCDQPDNESGVELGEPVPYEGEKRRPLLIAAALGAPLGTSDPLDLALLRAASQKEDLRRYQQLGFTTLDAASRHSVARVRRLGSEVERLIARGELQAILDLCGCGKAAGYRGENLQGELKIPYDFRELAVATCTVGGAGEQTWRFLGYVPYRAARQKATLREEPGGVGHLPERDRQLRLLYLLTLLILLVATALLMGRGHFLYHGISRLISTITSHSTPSLQERGRGKAGPPTLL
jgi:hypothetical protein